MKNFDKTHNRIFIGMGAIILALIGFIIFRETTAPEIGDSDIQMVAGQSFSNKNLDDHIDKNMAQQNNEPKRFKIYITGQIKNPGVIEVEEGSRLVDVVDLAGGLLDGADLKRINLALRVQDEGMYVIPEHGEEIADTTYEYLGQEKHDGKININIANQAELETLPRIGPVLARSIIEYREKNGPFKTEEDIQNVSGIGPKTFDGLKEHIIVR